MKSKNYFILGLLLFLALALVLPLAVHAATNAARTKTWTAERLYAADLNAEFDGLVNYLNNNIAFVTNITASAAELNQLNNNNILFALTHSAAVTDSANHTMRTGFVYTNNGRAVMDSASVDTLYDAGAGGTVLATGMYFVPQTNRNVYIGRGDGTDRVLRAVHTDTLIAENTTIDTLLGTVIHASTPVLRPASDLTGQLGLPTFRFNSVTADTGRFQVGAIDSITGTTIADTWNLVPKTDNTGTIGRPTKRYQAGHIDTVKVDVLVPAKIDTSAAFVIGRANIQTSAVDSTKILAATVSGANLRADAVDSTTIRTASVAGTDLAGTLSGNKIWTGQQTIVNNFPLIPVIGGVTDSLSSLWGTGATGAVANITDADVNATTIAQTGTVTLTDNRILRATGAVTISQVITVSRQNGNARGSFPNTWGSPGIPLGAVLSGTGSKGIPFPIRPGGGGTSLVGGRLQIIANGNISIGAQITAIGDSAASDGGGGGGLVVIVSTGTISGASPIYVAGAGAHATAAARGGGGGYSGEPGGHAGIGGSGGGGGGASGSGGSGGAGFIAGKAGGGGGSTYKGGGGGSLDNIGGTPNGSNGDAILANYTTIPTILGLNSQRPTTASSADGSNAATAGGTGGTNGGGGGGGGDDNNAAGNGGNGGAATSTNPVGSGGGGGGRGSGSGNTAGNGAAGSAGSTRLYALASSSVYAGLPGGMGGGGGGAGGGGNNAATNGSGGAGAAGAAGITPFVSGHGSGAGGAGATGSNGANGAAGAGGEGGAGGAGGNGGGAAGLVVLIAPTVTYSGTVTGRLVIISGVDAWKFIKGAHAN